MRVPLFRWQHRLHRWTSHALLLASQSMYDRFGRTLAYLDKVDGWDYSVEAARAGAAHSYVYHGHPSARADEIAAAEQEAKAASRGLWGPPCLGQTTSVPQ
jgi:micrococcal nuclease